MTTPPPPADWNDPWEDDPKMQRTKQYPQEPHRTPEDDVYRGYFWLGGLGGLITGFFWRELLEVARDLITNL